MVPITWKCWHTWLQWVGPQQINRKTVYKPHDRAATTGYLCPSLFIAQYTKPIWHKQRHQFQISIIQLTLATYTDTKIINGKKFDRKIVINCDWDNRNT